MLESNSVVLVTGATGFIGQTLTRRLLARGCQVRTLSRRAALAGPDAQETRHFQGDLRDEALLARACDGVDTVFHLAAYAHVNQHDLEQMRATNVEGTRLLLTAAVKSGVRRIVFFSSIHADDSQAALTAYGSAKREAEELLLAAVRERTIEVCCLRPANVYGLGMKGNLLTMIRLIERGVFPPLPTPGAAISLVGQRDLCEAALLAAAAPQANGKVYVVTDGRTYTMKGIEVSVRRALGRSVPRWQTPLFALWCGAAALEVLSRALRLRNAPGLRSYHAVTTDSVFSCENIQKELGYNPAASFTDELPAILQQLTRGEPRATKTSATEHDQP
jgi:nucleoside-diphosphate-sugar epimerase